MVALVDEDERELADGLDGVGAGLQRVHEETGDHHEHDGLVAQLRAQRHGAALARRLTHDLHHAARQVPLELRRLLLHQLPRVHQERDARDPACWRARQMLLHIQPYTLLTLQKLLELLTK